MSYIQTHKRPLAPGLDNWGGAKIITKMSLDIYLYNPERDVETICPCCDRSHISAESEELFHSNITHNLADMASAAGIYYHLWRPSEVGIEKAGDLIEPLSSGLDTLHAKQDMLRAYSPENGWGTYDSLVNLVTNYLDACRKHPDSTVQVDR